MATTKTLDEKFADKLRETIEYQENFIGCLQVEAADHSRQIEEMSQDILNITERNKVLNNLIEEETYFLSKFNKLLDLHLSGKLPKKEVRYEE